jgi:hypothetical protein
VGSARRGGGEKGSGTVVVGGEAWGSRVGGTVAVWVKGGRGGDVSRFFLDLWMGLEGVGGGGGRFKLGSESFAS